MSESNSWPLTKIVIFIFHIVILGLINEVTICCLPPSHILPPIRSMFELSSNLVFNFYPQCLAYISGPSPLPPGLCHSYPFVFIPSLSQVFTSYIPAMSLTKILFPLITYLHRIPKQLINTWKMKAHIPRPTLREYKPCPQTCSSFILLFSS